MMNRNLINGKPLEFGNREQIKIIRKASELYEGRKAVANVMEDYDTWGEDGEKVEEYQFLRFDCILPNCRHTIYERAFGRYFTDNQVFCCERCETEYQVRECECFHMPNS